MLDRKLEKTNRQIRSVTNIGIVTNLVLTVLKISVGILSNSMALVADGIHSFSDMITDAVVLLGIYFGSKEADPEHPYGHGRWETFSAIIIALILMAIAMAMVYKAALGITQQNLSQPGPVAIIVAFVSIIVKEWLYRITKKVGEQTHSSAVYGNAWHHRSDALSSVAVVAGLALVRFGFSYGDLFATIVVGIMIFLAGWRTITGPIQELSEAGVDEKTIERITRIIEENKQIRNWHKLRSRNVGREVFLDLHILVDPELNISSAHQIAENLENAIHEQCTRPVNITVHIEPDIPPLRK